MKTIYKRLLSIGLLITVVIGLVSWGSVGHHTIGAIAQNHLSQKAKNGVGYLLGSQPLADISSWADEVRNEPQYKQTAPGTF
jgi:hypothetical protein